MTQMFPHPRRIVTGHDDKGNSIVLKDSEIPCVPTGFDANFAVLWETSKFPASNSETDWDPANIVTQSLGNDKGLVLRIVDFKPNTVTAFHRTITLDFGMLFSGVLTCVLDNGVEINMKAGDVCVQRGTIHGWTNKTDKPARMYFLLSASEPICINGKALGDTGFHDDDVATGGEVKNQGNS